jgi:putative membrane protein insertion efficiency factor
MATAARRVRRTPTIALPVPRISAGRVPRTLAGLAATALLLVAALNARPLAIAGVHGYQRTLSPLIARAGLRCRFTPSCSHYAEIVIARDGALRGGWEAVKRVARCNPLTPAGTRDMP